MNVCPNCFADPELKAFISSSIDEGNCQSCGLQNVPVMNVSELFDFFQELLDNFVVSEDGEPLKFLLQRNWSFFADHKVATNILNSVLPELSSGISSADSLVNYTSEILDNYNHWGRLKEELKWNTRFLSDISFLEELGWDGFFNTQFELTHYDKLFQARVHHQSGLAPYPPTKMMTPNPKDTRGGRANPMGIPYLYLCDNPETVLYEVRASFLDELTVGTFQLKSKHKSIKIVDFTEDTSLFQPSRVQETMMARLLRAKISLDLSKPMRRYDTEIEYIPTQFICEFIRVYTGAGGIRFASSLHPTGKNIVIFDQELIQCTNVTLNKVTTVKLKSHII